MNKKSPSISKEELTNLYYEYKSIHKVGKILNKSGDTIWRWLKYYSIQPKPKVCNKCNMLLNNNNTYSSDFKSGANICKICRKKQGDTITIEKRSIYCKVYLLTLKEKILETYGEHCECCGENIWQFLTIDHINNWGAQHRKEIGSRGGKKIYQWLKNNNYPKDGFRILCMNCNACIGFHGFCPHQIKSSINCSNCNILLNDSNHFNFHKINKTNICKMCVLDKSIKRKTFKNTTNKRGETVMQRRIWAKNCSLNLRLKLVEGYGGKCMCCGENNYMFLTIDHINNNGAVEKLLFNNQARKFYNDLIYNNFPTENYTLLCSNCNCCKGFYGQCYHNLCKELNKNNISISEYKDIIL